MKLSAVLQREDDMFVALCPELDVVSQGDTQTEAVANLKEAIELLYEVGGQAEIDRRLAQGGSVASLEMELIAA